MALGGCTARAETPSHYRNVMSPPWQGHLPVLSLPFNWEGSQRHGEAAAHRLRGDRIGVRGGLGAKRSFNASSAAFGPADQAPFGQAGCAAARGAVPCRPRRRTLQGLEAGARDDVE